MSNPHCSQQGLGEGLMCRHGLPEMFRGPTRRDRQRENSGRPLLYISLILGDPISIPKPYVSYVSLTFGSPTRAGHGCPEGPQGPSHSPYERKKDRKKERRKKERKKEQWTNWQCSALQAWLRVVTCLGHCRRPCNEMGALPCTDDSTYLRRASVAKVSDNVDWAVCQGVKLIPLQSRSQPQQTWQFFQCQVT